MTREVGWVLKFKMGRRGGGWKGWKPNRQVWLREEVKGADELGGRVGLKGKALGLGIKALHYYKLCKTKE